MMMGVGKDPAETSPPKLNRLDTRRHQGNRPSFVNCIQCSEKT